MNYEYNDGYAIYDNQIIVNTLYMFLDAFPIYADVNILIERFFIMKWLIFIYTRIAMPIS